MLLSLISLLSSRMSRSGLAALTLGLILFGIHLGAAQAQAQRREIPHIVISATAIPTPADRIANTVTVITAEDIQREQRRTVPDVLAKVPGLHVVQSGGPGGVTSLFMRGTNSNHTKVLIDGIDVSNPSNPGRTFDLGQLLTADIERIEVLRGPQSGLYGADAIGGVISITTKKGSGPAKVTGLVEGGSFGTFNQQAQVSGSQANYNYALTAAHLRSTSTPVTPLELLPPGRKRNNDFYDNKTFSTKLGADLTENFGVNLVTRYTDAKLRFTGDEFPPPAFAGVPAAAQSTQVTHQFFTRGEAVWSLLNDRFKNYFGANYTDHWNWNKAPDPAAPTVNKGDRTKYDWRGVLSAMPGQTLVAGLEDETEQLRTSTLTAKNGNKAGYAEIQSVFANRIFLVGNVRRDKNDSFGGHSTYRFAPAVLLPVTETKLKGSYGTGFKAPTLTQLFVNFPFFFANPNLKPEESVGYDVGFEQPIADGRWRFGTTYFHNDIKNLIASNDAGTTNINIGKAETSGVEAFLSVAVTDRLKLRSDYTFTKSIDAITGRELLRRPWRKASITASWNPLDSLSLSATVLHVGDWIDGTRPTFTRVKAPGYTVVNVAADYSANERTSIFGRIDNLFNKHHQNPVGFEQPGFGIFGGVRVASR